MIDLKEYDAGYSRPFSDLLRDERKNMLFVGRITPNKKIEDLVKILFFYKKYISPSVRLIVAGNPRTLPQVLPGAARPGLSLLPHLRRHRLHRPPPLRRAPGPLPPGRPLRLDERARGVLPAADRKLPLLGAGAGLRRRRDARDPGRRRGGGLGKAGRRYRRMAEQMIPTKK